MQGALAKVVVAVSTRYTLEGAPERTTPEPRGVAGGDGDGQAARSPIRATRVRVRLYLARVVHRRRCQEPAATAKLARWGRETAAREHPLDEVPAESVSRIELPAHEVPVGQRPVDADAAALA